MQYTCVSVYHLSALNIPFNVWFCNEQGNPIKHVSSVVSMMGSLLSGEYWRNTVGGRGFIKFLGSLEVGYYVSVKKSSRMCPSHWSTTQSFLWPRSLRLVATFLQFCTETRAPATCLYSQLPMVQEVSWPFFLQAPSSQPLHGPFAVTASYSQTAPPCHQLVIT